jgi:quercetin dioxygenase-like cupin family protein
MRRARFHAIMLSLLVVLVPIGVTFGQETPLGVTVKMQSKFETVVPSTPFNLLMQVFELGPGAAAPVHIHSSAAYLMILEGELTNIRIVDGQRAEPEVYGAGSTLVEPAWGIIHEVANLGSARARFLSPRMQPKDTPVTMAVPLESSWPGAPPQRPMYRASVEVVNMSGPVDLYETWTDWSTGAQSAAHFHPGLELGIVIEGELVLTNGAGTITVRAGDSFVNGVGEIHTIANTATEKASLLTTYLIASERPLTFAAE